MAALFGLFSGGANERGSRPQYSIENLQQLNNKLRQIPQDTADEQNSLAMVEVIRQITEALIWGEQNNHDHNFFDFFCEKNILAEFVRFLGQPHVNRSVKVQLLQTLSMLVQNICRDTSLYYLFSNNYVNQLISTQFDWNDEEILGYYISFLKSLALRLNFQTITFFFNEREQKFPLYVEAVRFFGHQDQMVRTAIRTLTLQVFRIEDPAMQKFVLERSKRTYFVHLACYLRELWLQLDKAARDASGGGEQSAAALQDVNEQQQDLLMFLADVLELKNAALAEALAERLLRYALLPVILGSILPEADAPSDAQLLSPACALFVLYQVFDIFRSPTLLEPLATALLRPQISAELLGCCRNPAPPPPETYRATSGDISGPSSVELIALGVSSPRGEDFKPPPRTEADGEGTPALLKRDSDSENVLRPRLLENFSGDEDDVRVLLVAGIFNAVLCSRQILSQALLGDAGIFPRRTGELLDSLLTASPFFAGSSEEESERHPLEVLLLTIQALGHHTTLRIIVMQVLASFALALARELPSQLGSRQDLWKAPLESAQKAVRTAAGKVRSYLVGALGENFLDVYVEEWDLHCGPQVSVREACSSLRCLLPTTTGIVTPGVPEGWSIPAPHAERQHAAKAIRCMFLIRRLQLELQRISGGGQHEVTATSSQADDNAVPSMPSPPPPPPQTSSSSREALQIAVDEEECVLRMDKEAVEAFQEGRSFELGRQDRIVCGVVTQEGRHTRYLMLHPFLLLLVQPDLQTIGLAVVRTLCAVRQVEPVIDRQDPRTLRLGIRLPRGAPCPGEAAPYDPSAADGGFRLPAEEQRASSFFMLTLSFEDVKRCLCADQHLRKRRQEVRQELRTRVEAFIENLCT